MKAYRLGKLLLSPLSVDEEKEIGGEVSKHHWKNPEYLSISLIIKNHKIV